MANYLLLCYYFTMCYVHTEARRGAEEYIWNLNKHKKHWETHSLCKKFILSYEIYTSGTSLRKWRPTCFIFPHKQKRAHMSHHSSPRVSLLIIYVGHLLYFFNVKFKTTYPVKGYNSRYTEKHLSLS